MTSGKNSRVVAPLGEEVHSLFQTSVKKAEKALAARDFDGNASALGSPLVGRSAQNLAKTQPGENEWHASKLDTSAVPTNPKQRSFFKNAVLIRINVQKIKNFIANDKEMKKNMSVCLKYKI